VGSGMSRLWSLLLLWSTAGPLGVTACSRALFVSRNRSNVYAYRTMDWAFEFHTNLMFYPREQEMDGGCGGEHHDLCKTWTSKYWSLVATVNDWASQQISNFTGSQFDWMNDGAADGINEKGLAVHLLYLQTTEYATYEPSRDAVSYLRWTRYLLDMCASASEARDVMRTSEIVIAGVGIQTPQGTEVLGLHIAVEDATGDSAIFEIIGGKVHIWSKESSPERDLLIMTNDPPMEAQLSFRNTLIAYNESDGGARLKCDEVDKADAGSDYPNRCLPGDVNSRDRFTRLSWYWHWVSEAESDGSPKDGDTLLADLRSAILSVAVPQGAPDMDRWERSVYPTWWVSGVDFQRKLYVWQFSRHLSGFRVNLTQLSGFKSDTPLYLPACETHAIGDVAHLFARPPASRLKDSTPVSEATRLDASQGSLRGSRLQATSADPQGSIP